jgi:hypothetical protein
MRKNNNEDYEKLILLYFSYRNIYNMGYLRYSIFKNLIRYCTNIRDYRKIRTIFQNLVNKDVFDKKKKLNGFYYRFNPNKIPDIKPEFFIVSF